jgi:hypothetical protein
MEMVAMAALAAGTGISAMGTISGGSQQQQSANMQAGQLNEQAGLTRWRADRIREQAASLAEGERAAGKQELAEAQVDASEMKSPATAHYRSGARLRAASPPGQGATPSPAPFRPKAI